MAQGAVADGIDAAMNPVEASGANPVSHGGRRKTSVHKLGEGDHPVSPGGNLSDHCIRMGAFRGHTPLKAPETAQLAPHPAKSGPGFPGPLLA